LLRAFISFSVHPDAIQQDVDRCLAEDVGSGDLTSQIIPKSKQARATVITREPATICGQAWFDTVFARLDGEVQIDWCCEEGQHVKAGETLCTLVGPARALLSGERTALNFLQTLSNTATLASLFAMEVEGSRAQVLDTRKTIPGLRKAQKYAVACGGCRNHRVGLYDGILIKENHILSAGSIAQAVASAHALDSGLPVEIEVESMDEVRQAVDAGADILLLDNFTLEQLREAVEITGGRVKLEASGNVSLHTIRRIAETGVDYISVGALTKNVQAIDLSMRVELAD